MMLRARSLQQGSALLVVLVVMVGLLAVCGGVWRSVVNTTELALAKGRAAQYESSLQALYYYGLAVLQQERQSILTALAHFNQEQLTCAQWPFGIGTAHATLVFKKHAVPEHIILECRLHTAATDYACKADIILRGTQEKKSLIVNAYELL